MPNNIAFNRVADQLQTQVNGVDSNGTARKLLVDTDGKLVLDTVQIRELSAATDSIKLSSVLFTESSTTVEGVTDSAAIFVQDNSEQKNYSFYVFNTGSNTVTCNLQVSPTTTESYFVDDTQGEVALGPTDKYVLFTNEYMRYTRLFYETGGATCTFDVYYNAQV